MYICNTTINDRVSIGNILSSAFVTLEHIATLLEDMQNDYFGDAEQKPLNMGEAEDVANTLFVTIEMMNDVLLEYDLTTGRETFRSKIYMDSCKRVEEARRCDKLCSELVDAEHRMSAEERAVSEKARWDAAELCSDQAIPALEELLRRAAK